jgi:plastocyanin
MDNKYKIILLFVGLGIITVLLIILFAPQMKKTPYDAKSYQPPVNSQANPNANVPLDSAAVVTSEELENAKIEAPGANPITASNQVVTVEGKKTLNDVDPTSPQAPSQTAPLKAENLSPNAIKINIGNGGFSPNSFSVNAGSPVTIAVTSVDSYAHSFVFDNPALSAIGIGVYSLETRAVTFNAPVEKGEYSFRCNVGGHAGRGEVGKMIVK